MAGPHKSVALTRVAVRGALRDREGERVIVACSGGADSLALAAAVAFEAPRVGVVPAAVVVDHRLQEGSAEVAERAALQCRSLGLHAQVEPVTVGSEGGMESAARDARYAALLAVRDEFDASIVLTGHTRDDQAETVLLGLVRGSGLRSISGMPPLDPRGIARPFLGLGREITRSACTALGLHPWQDPHNADRQFLRVRARASVADLEIDLGPGIIAGLARTADLARADADYLDGLAAEAADLAGDPPWKVSDLASLPDVIRHRVWRVLTLRAGAAPGDVGQVHVGWLDALVTAWRGQGPVDIPGNLVVTRKGEHITCRPRPVE